MALHDRIDELLGTGLLVAPHRPTVRPAVVLAAYQAKVAQILPDVRHRAAAVWRWQREHGAAAAKAKEN